MDANYILTVIYFQKKISFTTEERLKYLLAPIPSDSESEIEEESEDEFLDQDVHCKKNWLKPAKGGNLVLVKSPVFPYKMPVFSGI